MTTYSQNCSSFMGQLHYSLAAVLNRRVTALIAYLALQANLRQERRLLMQMPADRLQDIGITRRQALAEARRTDIPASRMH
ncbi:MAG: hypothetical protein ACI9LO_001479 [Planctomycetota bacterium]|jgi:uncharacterized protein YjiS (DUF1127 family)